MRESVPWRGFFIPQYGQTFARVEINSLHSLQGLRAMFECRKSKDGSQEVMNHPSVGKQVSKSPYKGNYILNGVFV